MHALWWLFWVAVLVVVFSLVLPRSSMRTGASPLQRLQECYASGEISTEEYEERKGALERDEQA
jgi:putative membrane protein